MAQLIEEEFELIQVEADLFERRSRRGGRAALAVAVWIIRHSSPRVGQGTVGGMQMIDARSADRGPTRRG